MVITEGMQFKHLLYWTAVCCAVAQILMALYSRYYGIVAEQITAATLAPAQTELAVVKALNYALPVSVGCLLLLLYTWKINKVGGFAMLVAVALQGAAMDLNLRAARFAFGEETALASITWWAPEDHTLGKILPGYASQNPENPG